MAAQSLYDTVFGFGQSYGRPFLACQLNTPVPADGLRRFGTTTDLAQTFAMGPDLRDISARPYDPPHRFEAMENFLSNIRPTDVVMGTFRMRDSRARRRFHRSR